VRGGERGVGSEGWGVRVGSEGWGVRGGEWGVRGGRPALRVITLPMPNIITV
jgi:hypothetical protein